MKVKRNKTGRAVALGLFLLFLLQLILPAVQAAPEEPETDASAEVENTGTEVSVEPIYIRTAEDFLALAQSCSLDTWSQGKLVVLQADISLENTGFLPLPTFGGVFDGGGHTISGMSVTDSMAPAGLFGIVQENAVVKDLNVSGSVAPSGETETVGGIAGENNGTLENCTFTGSVSGDRNTGGIAGINGSSGKILNCSVSGAVFGENMTGGIAGYNLGVISACQNNAYINITSVDSALSPDEINLDFITDISKLYSLDTSMASSDTGGIAGYSSGLLLDCVNRGTVGYQHVGYNIGGIAGRSCGYLDSCTNRSDVYGRKDVGGIVGQMEPYIAMNLAEDTLSTLRKQMDELNAMIHAALEDADSSVGTAAARLNRMADYLDAAASAVHNIQTSGSVNSTAVGSGQAAGSGSTTVTPPTAQSGGSFESGGSVGVELDPPTSAGAGGSSSAEGGVYAGLTPGSVEGGQSSSAGGMVSASTQITLNTSLHQLPAAVNGLTAQMRLLNSDIAGTSGTLTGDLKEINDQVNAISDTLLSAMFGANSSTAGEILTDTSGIEIDAVTYGKATSCKNLGQINGDINIGGVAGTMAIEYELDPEDDLSAGLSGTTRREYELKAIVQKCVNTGAVIAKRNYAGSVCGYMDLGLITGCEGYGDTESENGSYVGGVAGLASGTVRDCFAKCALKGRRYIGGIVGSGVTGADTGASSVVSGCYALVSIPKYEQYAGGVAGADAGTFSENYYVAEGLAAINRLSYSGKAEPIAYADLLNVEGLPREFRHLTVRFAADGETIRTLSLDYGDSLDESAYPDIPPKDGYYARWDVTRLDDLCFDTVVTAVYTPYTSAWKDTQCREDGRPIFFVEGQFQDGDAAAITALALTPAAFGVASDDLGETLKSYFSFVRDRTWPDMVISREVVEQWSVRIPDDGLESHTVRYLSPDGETDNLDVYVKRDGQWSKAESEAVGSYLVFPVMGNETEVAVISTLPVWWVWLIGLALLLAVVLLLVRLIRKVRHRRAAAKEQRAPAAVAASVTADDAREQEALLHRAMAAEEELARNQAELRELRAWAEGASKKKRRWWIPLTAILVLLGCLAAGAALHFGLRLNDGLEAYRLLQGYTEEPELSMELTVQANLGSEHINTTARVFRTECGGDRVTCVEQDGISLYYSGDTVYLENGRAFPVNGLFPDYSELLGRTAGMYQLLAVSESENAGGTTYSIAAEGKDAETLLELLVPSAVAQLSDAQVVRVELTQAGKQLSELRFQAGGTLHDSAGTELAVTAVLTVLDQDVGAAEIPSAVREAMSGGNAQAAGELTEDLFQLLSAWSELESRDVLAAQLQLDADCGPLVLNDSMELFRTTADGQEISCIRKDGLSVYFTDRAFCDQNGEAVSAEGETLAQSARLWEVAYQACLNGTFSRVGSGGSVIYALTLDEAGMEAAAHAIAPDTAHMSVTLETGSVQITVEAGTLRDIQVFCSGSVKVVASDVPVSLSGSVRVEDASTQPDFDLPETVVRALQKES